MIKYLDSKYLAPFLVCSAYAVYVSLSTTDQQIFLNKMPSLPYMGIELSVSRAYFVAPIVLVFLYVYGVARVFFDKSERATMVMLVEFAVIYVICVVVLLLLQLAIIRYHSATLMIVFRCAMVTACVVSAIWLHRIIVRTRPMARIRKLAYGSFAIVAGASLICSSIVFAIPEESLDIAVRRSEILRDILPRNLVSATSFL